MDPADFNAIQPLLDKLADLADKQFLSAHVQRLLAEFASVVGPKKTTKGRKRTTRSPSAPCSGFGRA